ncbi:hypothetical protein MYX19_00225 [Nitrospinae bacterium AH-259-F20]|nr:hypothetical protein [Nitrospinae bacterium AH-259-F20]
MYFDTGRGVMVVVALTVGLLLTTGCATEKGRSAVGGAVYGSMIGTSIVPGIGSAIGAGVGMLAGAVEGAQKEKEAKTQEEAYRQKFYPPPRDDRAGGDRPARGPWHCSVATTLCSLRQPPRAPGRSAP